VACVRLWRRSLRRTATDRWYVTTGHDDHYGYPAEGFNFTSPSYAIPVSDPQGRVLLHPCIY